MTRDNQKTFPSFDGTVIAYTDEGQGPGVILLHGLSADGRLFGPVDELRDEFAVIARTIGELGVAPTLDVPPAGRRGLKARLLEAGARVIVPDLRGHGASGKPHTAAAYEHAALARDALALADHLRLGRTAVCGYSLGAIVAAKLLVLQPERVTSAVLAGIGKELLQGEVLELPADHPAAAVAKTMTMRTYNNFVADVLVRGDATPGHPGASYVALARAMHDDIAAVAAALRGDGAEQVPAAALHQVNIPVLLINGRKDPAHLATGRLLEVLADGRAVVCEGDHLDAPWQPSFQQAVVDFLSGQWRAGT
ncbi:MAG TPA: alpha/beta hydrolase [Hyphomicrobiaceae bacterium]|nr:alpha/beta hydrolase [Hyphomicrobiaceae bacterium]